MERHEGTDAQGEAMVIFAYTLAEAMADGVLHLMGQAGNGKPLMGTAGTVRDLSHDEIVKLFQQFFVWQRDVEPTLPIEDRMFSAMASNHKHVWVIEDGQAVTLLYPEEY